MTGSADPSSDGRWPDESSASAQLSDPATSAEALAAIVARFPRLRYAVLDHPNCTDHLTNQILGGVPTAPGRHDGLAASGASAGSDTTAAPRSGVSEDHARAPSRRNWTWPVIAGVVLLAVIGVAIGTGTHLPREPEHVPGPLESRLSDLPLVFDEGFRVVVTDLDRAEEILDRERPQAGDPRLREWFMALTGFASPLTADRPMAIHPPMTFMDGGTTADAIAVHAEDIAAGLGFDPTRASSYVEVSQGSFTRITGFAGPYSAEELTAALDDGTDGIWSWGGPRGGVDVDAAAINPPIGQSVWLAAAEDDVLVATSEGFLRAADDPEVPRLADDEALAGIARILDDRGAYTMGVDHLPFGRRAMWVEESITLQPFTMAGTGIADADAERATVIVVYHHETAELAAENVALLEAHLTSSDWIEGRHGRDHELASVEQDGRYAIVTFSSAPRAGNLGMWHTGAPALHRMALTHEQ